jgi:phage-related protein
MEERLVREAFFFGEHYQNFYKELDKDVKRKIDWTINLIETLENVPQKYFKHLANTDGLYEIRIVIKSNIYRIFSFFDEGKLIIIINGFHKKTNKTPRLEIDRALKIKKQYFDEK